MSKQLREKANQLAARPYTIRIVRDNSISEEPLFLALNPELDGCMAQGKTIEEAEENLDEFRVDYIEHLLEHNLPIPYPATQATITGSVPGNVVNIVGLEAKPTPDFEDVLESAIQPQGREMLSEAWLKTSESYPSEGDSGTDTH
jgi:predicted RNase H-like HicB family nuclease